VDAQGLRHSKPEFDAQGVGAARGGRCSVSGVVYGVAGAQRLTRTKVSHHLSRITTGDATLTYPLGDYP
jgi:hypothetical protein